MSGESVARKCPAVDESVHLRCPVEGESVHQKCLAGDESVHRKCPVGEGSVSLRKGGLGGGSARMVVGEAVCAATGCFGACFGDNWKPLLHPMNVHRACCRVSVNDLCDQGYMLAPLSNISLLLHKTLRCSWRARCGGAVCKT